MNGYYCTSVAELQWQLKEVGLYNGEINNRTNVETLAALSSFAASHGLTLPARSTIPGLDVALDYDFCQILKRVAGATFGPSSAAEQTTLSRLATRTVSRTNVALPGMFAPRYIIGRDEPEAAPEAEPPPTTFVPYVEPAVELGWWASQTPTVRYAIIGGGLLAVGAAAYYMTRSR